MKSFSAARAAVCLALLSALFATLAPWSAAAPRNTLAFALIGDRTGEPVPGIYTGVWRELAAEHPAFVVSVGDTIQGLNDQTDAAEWQSIFHVLAPYRRLRLYLAPGNHDVWSDASASIYEQYARHPLHYGFDRGPAHFTILDNSRSDQLSPEELSFLESDLKAHASQPVKFIVSHRPSWILPVTLKNPSFPLHQIAKKYGVQYVIAGHIHQMLHLTLEGVTYLSMPSAGGHLRDSKQYQDGWFFGYTMVTVNLSGASFRIKELDAPYGRGRTTTLANWSGMTFLETVKAAAAVLER